LYLLNYLYVDCINYNNIINELDVYSNKNDCVYASFGPNNSRVAQKHWSYIGSMSIIQ